MIKIKCSSETQERQSARMSEIINVGYSWMAKCKQLTSVPFKGVKIHPVWH